MVSIKANFRKEKYMEAKDAANLAFDEIWVDDDAFLSYVCANYKAPSLSLGFNEGRMRHLSFDGPIAPYEINTDWPRRRVGTVKKEEKELFKYFSVHGACGNKRSKGYFARKEHRTAAVSRLFQIDDARKKKTRQFERQENVEKRIADLEAFCQEAGRLPSSKSGDEHEKKLENFMGNIRDHKSATSEQKSRVIGITHRYGSRRSSSEHLADLIAFTAKHERWPRQGAEDAEERSLANWMRKSNLEKLSKKEKNKYDELESRYKPGCNKYLKLEPDAVIKELRRFIKSCGHYPRSRKPEQLEQGALYSWDDERRLAKAIKTYLEEGKFDSTQTKFIEEKRALLKPSGSTSYSEKLLLHALENALKDIDIPVRSNIKLCGVEVDVVLETNNGRIGIQYDGGRIIIRARRRTMCRKRKSCLSAPMSRKSFAYVRLVCPISNWDMKRDSR